MTEHRIRLRVAWDCHRSIGDEGTSSRLDLPIVWAEESSFPIQLVRRFGRPPFDPARESVALELRSVNGLRQVKLNGLEIANGSSLLAPSEMISIVLPSILLPRNAILLEVFEPSSDARLLPWGEIALVITPLASA